MPQRVVDSGRVRHLSKYAVDFDFVEGPHDAAHTETLGLEPILVYSR